MCGESNGTPLQYSCLENPMDGEVWWAAVHGVAEGRTRLRDFTFTFHFHALQKEMATHSSVLALRIPGMEEPGGLTSLGSQRAGHDWSDLAAAATIHLRRFRSQILPQTSLCLTAVWSGLCFLLLNSTFTGRNRSLPQPAGKYHPGRGHS